eukprot:2811317-Prymnesium_polylepis.1
MSLTWELKAFTIKRVKRRTPVSATKFRGARTQKSRQRHHTRDTTRESRAVMQDLAGPADRGER